MSHTKHLITSCSLYQYFSYFRFFINFLRVIGKNLKTLWSSSLRFWPPPLWQGIKPNSQSSPVIVSKEQLGPRNSGSSFLQLLQQPPVLLLELLSLILYLYNLLIFHTNLTTFFSYKFFSVVFEILSNFVSWQWHEILGI